MTAEIRRQRVILLNFSWEHEHQATQKFFTALHMSKNECKIPTSTDLGVTNKILQVEESAHMETTNNQNRLYIKILKKKKKALDGTR